MSKSFEYYRKKLEERKSIIADLEKAANEESRESSDDDGEESMISSDSNDDEAPTTSKCSTQVDQLEVEKKLIEILNDPTTDLPVFSYNLHAKLNEHFDADVCHKHIVKTLNKFHLTYKLINLEKVKTTNNQIYYQINEVFGDRVNAYLAKILRQTDKDEKTEEKDDLESGPKRQKLILKTRKTEIEEMLRAPLATETEAIKLNRELLDIVSEPTTKEKLQLEHFKSSKNHVQEYCHNGTKEDCFRWHFSRGLAHVKCDKIHFKRIIKPHTDISLGDCSFLNTCYNMNNCKYIHYEVDLSDVDKELLNSETAIANLNKHKKLPPQWIQCDLRTIDMRVLGKFSVIMADPPWDIHMELPYGTMADEEMRKLDIPSLQDEGYIFLWVTGRAMELGRECLKEWNYERCDEIIWVKTNQLQRIIRTGRTGHWLNHGKEHCLIGVKGKPRPELFNIGIDCDVIVAEVRATSHKPDEIYHIIERLSPGTRKVELFGRPHNVRPNWITLGNQLDGVRLIEPDVVKRFKARYPDGNALQSSTVPSSNSKSTNTSNNN